MKRGKRFEADILDPDVGREGEALAVAYLKKMGYRIVERNYRCQLGEIDIIAVEKKTICFIEVKTRTSEGYGSPEMSVNTRKQSKLAKVALWFLKERHVEDTSARFDVVAIRKRDGSSSM